MMYPNQQPPMQGMANQMAQHGRYGDSMLVHMNPIEVQGLASLSPTGSLTVNPVTGQPEAFLPFLAPLLGSLAGSAFLPTVIPALAGNAALAGAIGSGLATTAATGDLKQGILSGLTGYGLGSALQATADTLNPAIAGAEQALAGVGEQAATAASDLALSEVGLNQAINQASQAGTPFQLASKTPIGEAFSPIAQPSAPSMIAQPSAFTGATPQMSPALTQAQGLAETAGRTVSQQQAGLASLQGQQAGLQSQIDTARKAMTPMDRLTAPFQQPGAFGSAMMSPSTLVPIALGEGKREELRMQDEMDSLGRQEKRKRQEDLERSRQQMFGGFGQVSKDYDYSGYEVPMNYARAGGITSVNPQNYMQNLQGLQRLAGGGQTNYSPVINPAGAAQRQANIRGSEVISPAELQGYRPGFSPEIQYFKRPETTGAPQAGQDAVMGGEGAGQLSENQQQAINMALSGKGGMGFGGPNFDAMSYNYGANEPLSGMNAGSASTTVGIGQQGITDLNKKRLPQDGNIYLSNPRGGIYSRYTQEMQEGGEVAVDVAMQEQMPDESMAETSDANGGRLIELAALALLGRLPEEESKIVIEQFVMEFGEEALQMLRDRVLTDMSPNAQTEGKIEGNGNGMDDMVPGMIGDQQPVAVSPGEFIVPADVVSGLGDGDTDAGANELERMMEKVRQERTGTDQQPRPVNTQRVMPA
jgi:hypothetical protein